MEHRLQRSRTHCRVQWNFLFLIVIESLTLIPKIFVQDLNTKQQTESLKDIVSYLMTVPVVLACLV
jgi:hypothetical protein